MLETTVLTTGLLPPASGTEGGGEGVDLSGLAGAGGQFTPPALRTEHAGTDEMRYALQPVEIPTGDNLPTLGGEAVRLSRYVERGGRWLHPHGPPVPRAPGGDGRTGGPLAAFAEAEVRIIVRPTRSYALLFFESFHPYLLGDALDRDRLLGPSLAGGPRSIRSSNG